jgi:acetate kinase
METILIVNAGSSSLKFQVFAAGDTPRRLIRGQVDGIGTAPRLRAVDAAGAPLTDTRPDPAEVKDVSAAVRIAAAWLRETQETMPTSVGHRVVHGGPDFAQPVLIDADVLRRLERYVPLAPLHQPNNLATIRSIFERFPEIPQVACFDTAFHRSHDALADHYAIPLRFYEQGVRRYGFHGLSYEFVAERLREVAPEAAQGRTIVAHLGSGASMCALAQGRSVESSMGFTALDGLPMGTRPGQLDPGVVLYLIEQQKMSAAEVGKLLYGESGLKGLSGISNDVRMLDESADPRAAFALEFFAYRAALQAGLLAAALGGLDAFVFTAGIGENSPAMRKRIVDRLAWLGAELDPAANAGSALRISTKSSRIPVLVVPTDEELMIAKHTQALLSKTSKAEQENAIAV